MSLFFNSRDLFYDQHRLSDSEETRNVIRNLTGERYEYCPIARSFLNIASAFFLYNSLTRSFTQKIVAIENSFSGIMKQIGPGCVQLEDREIDALVYTLFWLSGHESLGESLAVFRNLLGVLPANLFEYSPDLSSALRIGYDLTYLASSFSPQARFLVCCLKITRCVFFFFKEYVQISDTCSRAQNVWETGYVCSLLDTVASAIHVYGSSFQLRKSAGELFA